MSETKIIAISCSRSNKKPKSLDKLVSYYKEANIPYYISFDASGMFQGYQEAFQRAKSEHQLDNDDIVILCHDDINILMSPQDLKDTLRKYLHKSRMVGFIGPAGTTALGKDCMWWHPERRAQGFHRGFVFQGDSLESMTPNYFGPYGKEVVVLDGCFLACTVYALNDVKLTKPDYLSGDWDFYDIHYTYSAYRMGKINYAAPIIIRHESNGEMRQEWHENNKCFLRKWNQELPARCK